MSEDQASAVAEALGGEIWQSGGGIWLVVIHRGDSHLVILSDEVVCEYESWEAFDNAQALTAVQLC